MSANGGEWAHKTVWSVRVSRSSVGVIDAATKWMELRDDYSRVMKRLPSTSVWSLTKDARPKSLPGKKGCSRE